MPAGSPQFTPRQLLDAGRRAEAEGKLDLAHQFYGHLSQYYGHTAEAAEGRHSLARIGTAGDHTDVWQMNGGTAAASASNGRMSAGRSYAARHPVHRTEYKVGRALAALVSGTGWLVVAGSLLALAAGAAAEYADITALQGLKISSSMLPQAAGALLAGTVTLLLGQAARALFDQASAVRELVAIERAKSGREQ
jgi:hypothetical protein